MPSRYQFLYEAMKGYEKSGIPLIAYDGKNLKPAGWSDDVGMYYFIPEIAKWFNLTLDQSINLFFIGMILVSLALGLLGFFMLSKRWLARLVAGIGLSFMAFISYKIGDLYVISPSLTVASIPWLLVVARTRRCSLMFIVCALLAGIGAGVAHYVRSNAGTGILIFLAYIVVFYLRSQWKAKVILIFVITAGFLAPVLGFNKLLDRRGKYLAKHLEQYKPVVPRHPLWHSIYIGFGFLPNRYGIWYQDAVAIEKARSVSPNVEYLSQEYEMVLKREVFALVKDHPIFVVGTLFAKLGIVSLYLLTFANIGLLAAALYPKDWSLELGFWSMMAFNSLFGIITSPRPDYLLGFIASAALYGIVSIHYALECGVLRGMIVKIELLRGAP